MRRTRSFSAPRLPANDAPVFHHERALADCAAAILTAGSSIGSLLSESMRCTGQVPRAWAPGWMAFQWCCIAGEWDLALEMLEHCVCLAPTFLPFHSQYGACALAEIHRANVFISSSTTRQARPNCLPGTLRLVKGRLDLLHAINDDDLLLQGAIAGESDVRTLEIPGTTNLGKFSWLADGDSRLSQICEIFLGGRYYWIPFEIISEISFSPFSYLLDRLWRPARVRLTSGEVHCGLVPSRYVGSQSADDDLKLGYDTLWIQINDSLQVGLGERQFRWDLGYWRHSHLRFIRFDAEPASLRRRHARR